MKNLVCDYLIIGSGAAPLAFLDTLLTELPGKKVILVDKKVRPGGHWVDAYDFVHLHQPSIVYGITSKQLEGNWAKLLFSKFTLPWVHRASKQELVDYYQEFVEEKCKSGQVEYFPECVYDLKKKLDDDNKTTFTSLDGQQSYTVEVRDKLVNGVQGECIIPSLTPPGFSVDKSIQLLTPNELYDWHKRKPESEGGYLSKIRTAFCGGRNSKNGAQNRHFVVLGAGKTAMDTVVFLQTTMGVSPSDISWVIPNDVWMMTRESNPLGYVKVLLDADGDKEKAAMIMEKKGQFVRLDPDVLPTRFRFPTVGAEEVAVMRKVDHKVRRGRVSSISQENGIIRVVFQKGDQDDWVIPKTNGKEHIFIHCTSPGPFNGKTFDGLLFRSERDMTLDLLFAPPISISMSCLAKLESAYQQGTIDTEFGRNVLGSDVGSVNEILSELIQSIGIGSGEDGLEASFLEELRSTTTQAMFVALLDKNPQVGYDFLKANRLSFMSIPGFKGRFVEDLELIVEKGKALGSPADQLEMIQKVAEKLEPLRGK